MGERVFLDWETPLLEPVVDWLWPQRDHFPRLTVIVPTAQAGRRLREALAMRGGCLAPQIHTPGWLMETPGAAPASAELAAWVETLEAIRDWSPYRDAFPEDPGRDEPAGWSLPLARTLLGVERQLQEAALTLESTANTLGNHLESDRWHALAKLWQQKESTLQTWNTVSRSSQLTSLVQSSPDGKIILAGVPDLPPAAKQRLAHADFTALIAAPESHADDFDATGCPLVENWTGRELPWPHDEAVTLAANPHQAAEIAVQQVAAAQSPSDQIVLGSADDETSAELTRAFGRRGWILHNPANHTPSPAKSWLRTWRAWLADPTAGHAIDLLAWPCTAALTGGKRQQKARAISAARDAWLTRDRRDVERARELADPTREREIEQLTLAAETLDKLEKARAIFLQRDKPFATAMRDLLDRIDRDAEWLDLRDSLLELAPITSQVNRHATFWIDLLLETLPDASPDIPADRVLDVHGWLELLHEPEPHLIVCGMNEGRVPAPPSSDPWLSEPIRHILDLTTNQRRAARDAYLFLALTRARQTHGRCDFLLAKTSHDGDALRPSRLLLAASGDELARRVQLLFRDLEPPDAGTRWEAAWPWTPPAIEPKTTISVTKFRDFLACPFRYYLKNVARMNAPDPERIEWNDRDFGNATHLVLDRWARDPDASDFSKTEAIAEWLDHALSALLRERHGDEPPLAVRIQAEILRDRLHTFARLQACERAAGWRVVASEVTFRKSLGDFTLSGTIDRIDHHTESNQLRLLDYKTFNKISTPEAKHLKEIKSSTTLPPHLENIEAVLTTNRGKDAYWTDLQLPLYAWALDAIPDLPQSSLHPDIGYVILGKSSEEIDLRTWQEFTPELIESAATCARWVTEQIAAEAFWPPAEKVQYDDFEALGFGHPLDQQFAQPTATTP